jgi:lincosamide nucleotidyltransferase A/C/D/E
MADDSGHEVDLHPVVFDKHGRGVQAGLHGNVFHYPPEAFADGTIAGRRVPRLSAEQQVIFHTGYPLRAKEKRDLARLAERFGVRVPPTERLDTGTTAAPG